MQLMMVCDCPVGSEAVDREKGDGIVDQIPEMRSSVRGLLSRAVGLGRGVVSCQEGCHVSKILLFVRNRKPTNFVWLDIYVEYVSVE